MLDIDTVLVGGNEPLLYTSQTGRVAGYSNEPSVGRIKEQCMSYRE